MKTQMMMVLADSAAVWSPGDLYKFAEPYVLSVLNALILALIGVAVAFLKQKWGIDIDATYRNQLQTAAENAAGRIMASQEANFAHMEVKVGNPLVAEEIPFVLKSAEAAVTHLGVTPDRVEKLILAKVGQLQVAASAVPGK